MDIDNKLLQYIEGQLTGQDKYDFESLIKSNQNLRVKLDVLTDVIDNSKPEKPPYQVRQKIYDMLKIKDLSFMNIVIKKTDQILNILSGKNYVIDFQPTFITRSNEKSLLFSTKMNDFDVLCDVYFDQNEMYLLKLSAYSDNSKMDNIKFSIIENQKNLLEKYTNSEGSTDSFKINFGIYHIHVSKNESEIGNIKINLS